MVKKLNLLQPSQYQQTVFYLFSRRTYTPSSQPCCNAHNEQQQPVAHFADNNVHCTVSLKKLTPPPKCFLSFSGNISPMTENFKIKFYTSFLYVHIYTILPNFLKLSLILTKLRHITQDHLVNFYIILKT